MNWFIEQNYVLQAFLATLFTFAVTALGSSLVFFFKSVNKGILNVMLGFGAGVMLAAAFWSLLAPSIELSEELGWPPALPTAIGFLFGASTLFASDIFIQSRLSQNKKSGTKRSILLVVAITLHNIPEGLAIGVAFGAAGAGIQTATIGSAVAIAIGIGLQNFPEGTAISLPLRRDGLSRTKSFIIGASSAIVEPIAGLVGALLAVKMQTILPFALSYAAGAMIYVVVEELIPEGSNKNNYSKFKHATIGCIFGFIIMMILDVSLG